MGIPRTAARGPGGALMQLPHSRAAEVEQLYFVGAGTHPGAGLPGTLLSAEIADRLVAKDVWLGAGASGRPAPWREWQNQPAVGQGQRGRLRGSVPADALRSGPGRARARAATLAAAL